MEAQEKEIEYYETEEEKHPFRDWFLALRDKETRNKIDARVRRVELGNLSHCKPVGEGVTELKIDFGPGYRVYFGQVGNRLVILLNGGDKSTQKKDIKTAHEYWADYRRRHG
ncbi:MAG: type II toxin-antitoxin system RelE/ParE family toxin [Pyrinomonadaceae bacterium]